VSGGSACNTGGSRISYVIDALGVPEEYAPGTVRMTLCGSTTRHDIDTAVESLKKNVALLRG
jgi:cysteine desulfurase